MGMGAKKDELSIGCCLGCWILQWYCPFLPGAHIETYEPFFSLIFLFFSGWQ
jgi:hypothetical protein